MTAASLVPPKGLIGHRGAAAYAPENTLASLRLAADQGAGWVEFDVRLSMDGVPFLLHDDALDRTTDGKGPAGLLSMDELKRLDAGSWFAPRFTGERLPTFAETVALCRALGVAMNVEIKPNKGEEAATVDAVVAVIGPAAADVVVSSFKLAALERAQAVAPDLARGLLIERLPSDWRDIASRLGCVSVHPSHKALTEPAVAQSILGAGYMLLPYTVNDAGRVRELLDWGVTAVITDKPDVLTA
jgi:glycerophosphoryl diester phosphodiesterase